MRTRRYFSIIQICILAVYLLFFSACKSDKVITCDPDIYESNESLNLAYSLGSLEEETGTYNARISTEDDLDFYTITATEGSHIGGIPYTTPQYFRVTFELTLPDGNDYDLYIYNEAGTVLGQSNERGDQQEDLELDWEGVVGVDDSMVFGIEVRPYAGDWDCKDYTVTITMLYSDSPWL